MITVEELKYTKSGTSDGHVRRQQKISARLKVLLSTESPTACYLINQSKERAWSSKECKKEWEATEATLDVSGDVSKFQKKNY